MSVFEGDLIGKGKKFAVVVSRFNDFITKKLLEGAIDAFKRHGVDEKDIDTIYTPGSFEIPYAAQKIAKKKKHDAILALGTIIRGETPHFEYIASSCSRGITNVGLESGIPVIFGIITADTNEQAIDRAGIKGGNKGYTSAVSAIEMANLLNEI